MLLPERQRHVFIARRRQTLCCHAARPVNTSRARVVCRAHELTGEAYEDIVDQLARRALDRYKGGGGTTTATPTTRRRVVVGIAGAPGSGKTTLAAAVAERLNQLQAAEEAEVAEAQGQERTGGDGGVAEGRGGCGGGGGPFAAVVPMDGFHYYRRELDAMPDPQEAHARRGAPWTFDAAKFVQAVRRVRDAGAAAPGPAPAPAPAAVCLPSFDHGVGDPVEGDIEVAADTAVVLVEGNYLLLDQEPWCQLRELFDESWFVRCPLDLIRQRLFDRQTGIGLAPEVSLQRIATNDLPNAELVAACEGAADVRVSGWVRPRGGGTARSGRPQRPPPPPRHETDGFAACRGG